MSRTRLFTVCAWTIVLGILDVYLKKLAIARFPSDGSRVSFPLGFALHKNPGIAFDIPIPLLLVFLATFAIGSWVTVHAYRAWKNKNLSEVAACFLLLVGALGNFFDRLMHGFTTDYLILFGRSAINISDILILLGMIGFLRYHKTNPQNSRS